MMRFFLLVSIAALVSCGQTTDNSIPGAASSSIDAAGLFKLNCSQCHRTSEDFIAPALKGVRERWKDHALLYEFVRNSQEVIKKDEYAKSLFEKWNKTVMQPFPNLTDEQIAAILDYADKN